MATAAAGESIQSDGDRSRLTKLFNDTRERYSVNLHLRHDPTASEAFAEIHVRRLEALRRVSNVAERNTDGSWTIASDHLARVEAHERERATRAPVTIETLSARPVGQLIGHDGKTWLDRTLVAADQPKFGGGFDSEVSTGAHPTPAMAGRAAAGRTGWRHRSLPR